MTEHLLFLCTGNSCRSQMAEAWARHFHAQRFLASSAGIEKHGLNPLAVQVMAEAGIDISGQLSKTLQELSEPVELVITVCGHARDSCPIFPGLARVRHRGFDDPPRLAEDLDDEQEILDCYRRVRDEIRDFVQRLPEWLE